MTKAKTSPPGAAAVAVPESLDWMHVKALGFLFVERAERAVLAAAPLELHVAADGVPSRVLRLRSNRLSTSLSEIVQIVSRTIRTVCERLTSRLRCLEKIFDLTATRNKTNVDTFFPRTKRICNSLGNRVKVRGLLGQEIKKVSPRFSSETAIPLFTAI